MARSSSDQCEIGRPRSAGLVVARTRTLCRSSGGKSPRGTAAREVGQAVEAVPGEARPPLADGGRVAAELGGDVLVRRAVGFGATQDEAAAKSPGLGGGVSVAEFLQVELLLTREADQGGASGHGAPSLAAKDDPCEQGRT